MSTTSRTRAVPRAKSTDKRFYGVVEAIVMEVIDPEKEGKVKIQFPWFDDDLVTEFCRVGQVYAGNGYGAFFVPEVGDEVLVAFVHGDMRMPVILGGLYNGKDKPPSDRQQNKDQKMLRTKAGHELLFDDSAQERKLVVKTAGGHELALDDRANTVTLKTSGGQSITLDVASSKITIQATTVAVQATSVQVQAGSVELGTGAAEPVLLGATFATYMAAHVHTTGIPGLPTSPPVVPMPPTALSKTVRTA